MDNNTLLDLAYKAIHPHTERPDTYNPLNSNSQAFTLAITLELDIITPSKDSTSPLKVYAYCTSKDKKIKTLAKTEFTDPFKGVRKAIVLAAAQVTLLKNTPDDIHKPKANTQRNSIAPPPTFAPYLHFST